MDYQQIVSDVKEITIDAGKKILDIYNSPDFEVETKADNSPITKADKAANDYIVKKVREKYPDFGLLSEESKDTRKRLEKEHIWVIDPLDGTKEFIKRNGEFTVNVGLVKNGNPVLGVVFIPVRNEVYYAVAGGGAFYENASGEKLKIKASSKSKFEEMVMVKSRSHASDKLKSILDKYEFKEVKDSGSSIKICLIAFGLAEIYFRFGNTNEWDICAAHCVLSEAGGKMTDCHGNPLEYNKADPLNRNGFIASNNAVHDKFVQMAKEVI